MSKYRETPELSEKMPSGIPYIIGNEAAERFSFYGMKAILTVFLVNHLVVNADTTGFSDAKANAIVHLFVFSAYFFPLIGALISDAIWGKYRTIMTLSIVYCIGHLCLAFMDIPATAGLLTAPGWLYLGLFLIAVGSGGIKPCVSAHVGDQFGSKNKHLFPKIYGWFYLSINLGAFLSTLLTPKLLQLHGPAVAFGVPGILMGIATLVFWLGRNRFVHIPPSGWQKVVDTVKDKEGMRAIGHIVMIYLPIMMFWGLFDQTASSWVQQSMRMDREFMGVNWLPSQVQAINPLLILILIPVFTYGIYPAINKVWRLTPLRKIGLGMCLAGIAFSIPAMIEGDIKGGRVMPGTSNAGQEIVSMNVLEASDSEHPGWLSRKLDEEDVKKKGRIDRLIIRLRERKAWKVSEVRVNPAADLPGYFNRKPGWLDRMLGASQGPAISEAEARKCWTTKVSIWAGDSPAIKEDKDGKETDEGWKKLGEYTLKASDELQSLKFDPVEAEFIRIDVLGNGGAMQIALDDGKVESRLHAAIKRIEVHTDHSVDETIGSNVGAIGHKPNISWQLFAYLLMTMAEVMISITGLEFSYTQAPRAMKSFVMALWLLFVAFGNLFTAAVNIFIAKPDGTTVLEGASYFWFFNTCMWVAAGLFVVLSLFYKGKTYVQGEEEAEETA